jgi:hypothetical protein
MIWGVSENILDCREDYIAPCREAGAALRFGLSIGDWGGAPVQLGNGRTRAGLPAHLDSAKRSHLQCAKMQTEDSAYEIVKVHYRKMTNGFVFGGNGSANGRDARSTSTGETPVQQGTGQTGGTPVLLES